MVRVRGLDGGISAADPMGPQTAAAEQRKTWQSARAEKDEATGCRIG